MILDQIFGLELRHVTGKVITGVAPDQEARLNEVFGRRGETSSGVDINEESALGLSAVYAAVRLLSWSRALLPVGVYERTAAEGDKEARWDHAVHALLNTRPNPDMTPFAYHAVSSVYELLWGRSVSYIETLGNGKPGALWPLPVSHVGMDRIGGHVVFDITRVPDPPTDKPVLSAAEVVHVPNVVGAAQDGKLVGVAGRSVISYAREQLGEASAAQRFSGSFWKNGAMPAIVIKHPGRLKDANKLRKNWEAVHSGVANAGKTAVLEEAMELEAFGMPLDDAQFLESRQFHITEVARWFGVPPHKLRDLTRATFSNIAEQKLEWHEDLLPWLTMSQQEWNYKLFTSAERKRLFTEHIVEGLLKGDIEKRYNAYSTALQWGFMSRNEVRRRENLNSMGEDGDTYMVPSNMMDAAALTAVEEPEPEPVEEETPTPEPEPVEQEQPTKGESDAEVTPETTPEDQTASELLGRVGGITGMTDLIARRAEGLISDDALVKLIELFYRLPEDEAVALVAALPEVEEKSEATPDTRTFAEGPPQQEDEPEEEDEPTPEPPEQRSLPDDSGYRRGIEEEFRRQVIKEAGGVLSAAKRPRTFLRSLDRIYETRAGRMVRALRPPIEALLASGAVLEAKQPATVCREHCERSYAALLDLAGGVTADKLHASVQTEVGHWESDLPGELTDKLLEGVQI